MRAGDPVLLLHGQPGSAQDWEGVRAAMRADARTIAIDRPGWDGRTRPTGLEGNADAALDALRAERVERATVVGHSFGAAVAAWLAVGHPELVGSLVPVAPAANVASLNRLDRLLAAPIIGPVLSATVLAGGGLTLRTAPLRGRIAGELALDDHYLKVAGRVLLRPASWRAFVLEQRLLLRDLPALEGKLAQITAPTKVVVGSADRIVPPAAARRLTEQIPGAELVLVDRADHLLPLRNAERLAELIVAMSGRG